MNVRAPVQAKAVHSHGSRFLKTDFLLKNINSLLKIHSSITNECGEEGREGEVGRGEIL